MTSLATGRSKPREIRSREIRMEQVVNLQLLKALSEAPGISGREERVREILKKEMKSLFDEIVTDTLGNLIATAHPKKNGKNAKRVLISCHMNEIFFYVKHVDDKGF